MRSLLAAVIAVLLTPSLARAQATITMREVPLGGARSLSSVAHTRFDLIGLHWRGSGSVSFRTRTSSGRWSSWHAAAPESEDQPDVGTKEGNAAHGWRLGNPFWTGGANVIAYRLHGRVTRLRAYFVWSPVDDLPPRHLSIAGSPQIIPRASWGADESIRRAPPSYADALRFALVHHTAGSNNYSPSQSAAIVRGIEIYHVKGNGWNDIGYNFLVDRYGQVFEGRYGGVDQPVIGAHAEGFNTGSVGAAVLGTYDAVAPPPAAQDALTNLLAWRLDIAHVDPLSRVMVTSGGNPRFAAGVPVFLRAISGHRDTGFTSCPGNALYARLGVLAAKIAAAGTPKLYAPSVTGQLGGPIEFKATLTAPLPWTVTVTNSAHATVASGSGTGTDVDWVWDAAAVPPGRYAWTIAAGADVRPATGLVGAAPVPLALKTPAAKPATISPNGDGVADRTTVSYTLTTAATVTATLTSADGVQLATLFSDRRSAGKHAFTFAADGVADGRYDIVLSATDGKTTVSTTLPVTVDRTLGTLAVAPGAFSPNGDGRDDTMRVTFQLERAATVRVEVRRKGAIVATLAAGGLPAGAQSIEWDGSIQQGRAPDGLYAAVVSVTSSLGTTTDALPFRIDTVAPVLRALSFRHLVFRISEPARVTLVVDTRVYARAVRAGVFSLRLGRPARRVRLSAVDMAGNVSRTLRWP